MENDTVKLERPYAGKPKRVRQLQVIQTMTSSTVRTERISRHEQVFRLVLAMVVFIAGVLALILVFVPAAPTWFNTLKTHELATQFLFVVVLGGGITAGYRETEA